MKHLRETFTDQEWQQLKQAKEKAQLNWHDYILSRGINYSGLVASIYCANCHSIVNVDVRNLTEAKPE